MKLSLGCRTGSSNVASIRGDFWMNKNDLWHEQRSNVSYTVETTDEARMGLYIYILLMTRNEAAYFHHIFIDLKGEVCV